MDELQLFRGDTVLLKVIFITSNSKEVFSFGRNYFLAETVDFNFSYFYTVSAVFRSESAKKKFFFHGST